MNLCLNISLTIIYTTYRQNHVSSMTYSRAHVFLKPYHNTDIICYWELYVQVWQNNTYTSICIVGWNFENKTRWDNLFVIYTLLQSAMSYYSTRKQCKGFLPFTPEYWIQITIAQQKKTKPSNVLSVLCFIYYIILQKK